MSRVALLSAEEAPLPAKPWYGASGTASPLVRSLATAPDVLEPLLSFVARIMDESGFDDRTCELVVLRASYLNSCRYCLAAHTPLARAAGLGDAEIAAARGGSVGVLTARERAILAWTDQVTCEPAATTDELAAEVRRFLREHELVELTVLVGAVGMLNRYCTALDLPSPT